MKSGKLFLKKLTGFIAAAVFALHGIPGGGGRFAEVLV